MNKDENARKRNRDIASSATTEEWALADGSTDSTDVAGILDERIRNLREAIGKRLLKRLKVFQQPQDV
jgi:hypothetical protein